MFVTRLAGVLAAFAILSGGAAAQDAVYKERSLGKADAPVEVIEYASLTCGHCGSFHTKVLPKVKSEFIDTGKVRLIYRDMPTDQTAFAVAALARCVPEANYFPLLEQLYAEQGEWTRDKNPPSMLEVILAKHGLPSERIEACLGNEALLRAMADAQREGAEQYKITGTPTLIIDGVKFVGNQESEAFLTAIRNAVAAKNP